MGKVLFVTGIDTNIGKTYATGLLAKAIAAAGKTVITQKMVQTGCLEVRRPAFERWPVRCCRR